MRDFKVVGKVKETGGSRMIIVEILGLFAYIVCPIFLLPLVWWSEPQIDEVGEGKSQGWDYLSWK